MTARERALKLYPIYAEARDKKKMTDYQVADKAEIPSSAIYDWKYGSYTPNINKLAKIANVVGLPLTTFVIDEKEEA